MSNYIAYDSDDAISDFPAVVTTSDLVSLTNDGTNSGEVNTTVLNRSIADMQEFLNGYLARITSVPLTSVPTLIKRLHARLVVDDLRLRRHKTRDMEQEALYKDLVKQLEDIASGKIVIETTPAITRTAATVSCDSRERIMTGDELDYLMQG